MHSVHWLVNGLLLWLDVLYHLCQFLWRRHRLTSGVHDDLANRVPQHQARSKALPHRLNLLVGQILTVRHALR